MYNSNHILVLGSFLLAIIAFVGCKDNNLPTQNTSSKLQASNHNNVGINRIGKPIAVEEAFPNIKGKGVKIGGIGLVKKGTHYILQGDIVLSNQQVDFLRRKGTQDSLSIINQPEVTSLANQNNVTLDSLHVSPQSAVMNSFIKLWPKNTVYYTISGNYDYPSRINAAISAWETNTNIAFKQRTDQSNYIEFDPYDKDCYSSGIGMVGGKQYIRLSSGCYSGQVIHEIGHAIGLFHEQARQDRDNYITIHEENIEKNQGYNFDKYNNGEDIGSFDFNSIMMYPYTAFSKNGEPTITKKDGSTYNTQRNHLTSGDIQGIDYLYPRICVQIRGSRPQERGGRGGIDTHTYRTWSLKFYSEPGCNESLTLGHSISVKINKLEKSSQSGPYQYDGSYTIDIPAGVSSNNLDIVTTTDIRRGANGGIEGYDKTTLSLKDDTDYNIKYKGSCLFNCN